MKKVIYALILPMVVIGGLVFAHRGGKSEVLKKPNANPVTAADRKAARERWEATPDGIMYKKWVASPAGRKVFASIAKIRKHTTAFTDMEAVVTSLSLPPGSRLGFGLMVRINGDDYIVSFGPEKSDKNSLNSNSEFKHLHNLKVDDKIIIKSHHVMHAPKYAYPVVSGEYVERDGKAIYKRAPSKGGC